MERLEPGSDVGGYRVLDVLGSGGTGTVYRAADAEGTQVALKVLRPGAVGSRDRLRREAAALQRVRHPALARVLDLETDAEPAFIVTELVDGPDLAGWGRRDGPATGERLADLADRLRGALGAVHSTGVVHRDVAPGNV